jgi:membrane-associated phospholipid phosphatase
MEYLYDFGINFIQFLQGLGDWLIPPMKFFTNLGVEEFYLLVIPILYWCIDTTAGIRTAIMLMISTSIYNYIKWLFHEPRPYWVSSKITAHLAESSFGLPSGHAQNSVTIWGIIAHSFKKNWGWVIAAILMFFIGISRLVLGLHFPQDTILGWLLGIILLFGFIKLEPRVVNWLKKRSISQRILTFFLLSMMIILIGYFILVPLKDWTLPVQWADNITIAFPGEELINPLALSSQVTLGGVFFGLTFGYTVLFAGAGFDPKGIYWKRILRYFVGLIGIVIIWYGLDLVFPDGENLVPLIFRYIRYFLVGLWVTYLGPLLFIRLRLAKPSKI